MTNTFFMTSKNNFTDAMHCASASFCAKKNDFKFMHITFGVCFFVALILLVNSILNAVISLAVAGIIIIISLLLIKVFLSLKVRECIAA